MDLELSSQWGKLIGHAREEGELVVVLGSTRSLDHPPIFKRFTEKFGVRVISTTNSGPSHVRRVLAERADSPSTLRCLEIPLVSSFEKLGLSRRAPEADFHPPTSRRSISRLVD